jgi:N-methylhydantoinase B
VWTPSRNRSCALLCPTLEAPRGIFGGFDGLPAAVTHNPGAAAANWPSKSSGRRVATGDVIRITGANAAGNGKPRERAPDPVLDDWLDAHLSCEIAHEVYGVAIGADRRMVDYAATAELRSRK